MGDNQDRACRHGYTHCTACQETPDNWEVHRSGVKVASGRIIEKDGIVSVLLTYSVCPTPGETKRIVQEVEQVVRQQHGCCVWPTW